MRLSKYLSVTVWRRGSNSPAISSIFVQAAAFSSITNAQAFRAKAAQIGEALIEPSFSNGRRIYRVKLGPYGTIKDDERAIPYLADLGAPSAHVTVIQ